MSERQRRPAAFRLDDPNVTVAHLRDEPRQEEPARGSEAGRSRILVTQEPEEAAAVEQPAPAPRRGRLFGWGALFWSALGGLVTLGLGMAVTRLVEDLFARAAWLGSLALAMAILAALALLVVTAREAYGLIRLRAVEKVRARADATMLSDDREDARAVVRELLVLTRSDPRLARGRGELERHLEEIIDGADLLRLAERNLMTALDAEARRLVASAAKRVSVVTAVSPRAAIDIVFVFITALKLIRRLADLYGGRPGALGLVRLIRQVIAHLAVTGGMAAGDALVQQMVGHGLAAKLSARLGEGVLNGLLTARLGLAAIDVVRPLPFSALPRPALSALTADLLGREARKPPKNERAGR